MSIRPEGPRGIPSAHPAVPAWRRLRQATGLHVAALADALTPRRALLSEALALLTLRRLALGMVSVGVLTCLVPIAVVGYGMWQEEQLTRSWDQLVSSRPSPATAATAVPAASPDVVVAQPSAAPTAAATAQAQLQPAVPALFTIRVPKIGYYAAVREGISTSVLATGPGHYPTTALPGGQGLVAVAAHNTFWIPFGQLGAGDSVILQSRSGTFTYHVTGTRIVNPDDRTVLASTSSPTLVLTTCWPLWAGNLAGQRLAIFAQPA